MSYGLSQWLRNSGMCNFDAPDLRELQGEGSRDYRATFCSSSKCTLSQNYNYRGTLVYVGNKYLDQCSRCGTRDGLYYDTATPLAAKAFFSRIGKTMPSWIETIE